MSWREKCAVMGVWNHPEASSLTYLGLYALQHRGQEGAGIVSSFKNRHISYKAQGLVGDVFSKEKLQELQGSIAIGHTRYSTTGQDDIQNIQPFTENLPGLGEVSVSHNGNIVNYPQLKKRFPELGKIDSDTRCVYPLLKQATTKDPALALKEALSQLEGAFSLALIQGDSLIAVRDPLGFRPLVLGKKDQAFFVASETCAFDLLGASYIREIEPGEILVINQQGLTSTFLPKAKKQAQCIFEHVYFSRPDSLVFQKNVYKTRKEMGKLLAKEHPVSADFVVPVPDSGVPAGIGYAQASGLPFEIGIIRNHYIGRTFIQPSSPIRDFKVRIKLNPQSELIRGKSIVVVDDSIVRGTTSKSLIEILRQAGAREVHLRVSSPPIKSPCFYGVDTPEKKNLIYEKYKNIDKLCKYLKADSLAYLSLDNLSKSVGKGSYCQACFDEKYPTPIYNDSEVVR